MNQVWHAQGGCDNGSGAASLKEWCGVSGSKEHQKKFHEQETDKQKRGGRAGFSL